MSYRGILTDHAHALAASWLALLGPSDDSVVIGREVDVDAAEARTVVDALADAGADVCDLGIASADELAYVSAVLALPAIHLAADHATGLRLGTPPVELPEEPTTGPADLARRPGHVSTDDLTDDYVAHLRSLAPLHGIRPVHVALTATGTAALTAPLALADSGIVQVGAGDAPDVHLAIDAPSRSLVVRDERGRLVRPGELAGLLSHHDQTASMSLFSVASPLLLARTVLGIIGHSTEPLSVLVADAEDHRDTLSMPVARFDDAAQAVERAFSRLAPTRRPGTGLRLTGHVGTHGDWMLSLRRQPGPGSQGGALLVVQAEDPTLRTALREDARAILLQYAPAA